jgi:pyruvate dehydrogenase E1 component alpha subunit
MLVKTFKLSEKEIEEIHQRVQLEVDESVQFAEDSPWPDDDELLKDVYVQQDYPFITD